MFLDFLNKIRPYMVYNIQRFIYSLFSNTRFGTDNQTQAIFVLNVIMQQTKQKAYVQTKSVYKESNPSDTSQPTTVQQPIRRLVIQI